MQIDETEVLYQFRKKRGLLGIKSKVPVRDEYMLSLLYTPGVAEPCRRIAEDRSKANLYTTRGNSVALISDASHPAVERFGISGVIPFLESRALLCRELAAIDAYPFPLDVEEAAQVADYAALLTPTVSILAFDLVSYPRSRRLQRRLQELVDTPVVNLAGEVIAILLLTGLHNVARRMSKRPADLSYSIEGCDPATDCLRRLAGQLPFRAVESGQADVRILGESASFPASPDRSSYQFDLRVEGPDSGSNFQLWNPRDIWFHPTLIYPGVLRGLLDCRLPHLPDTFLEPLARTIAMLQPEELISEDRIFPNPLQLETAPAVSLAMAKLAEAAGYPTPSPQSVYQKAIDRLYAGSGSSSGKPLYRKQENVTSDDLARESLELHEKYGGAIEVVGKLPVRDEYMLRILSPPHLQAPARAIRDTPLKVFEYSCKSNLVAVISDGSAVLGLGNIGPEAGLPVMEGKALLLKTLAGVESIPICLNTQRVSELVGCVKSLLPILGGVNLEDISSPRCFEIEEELRRTAQIPIFHDDQHGTAVVVLAGILNACRCLGKEIGDVSIIINGAGASAAAVARLLLQAGAGEIVLCDRNGAINRDRVDGMNAVKAAIADSTNPRGLSGPLGEVIRGFQFFVGLSAPGCLTPEMVREMAPNPVIFALANPTPEIMPADARSAGAAVVATGRSDFRNQINNALAFPGIFRGALDVRARQINDPMKLAAAGAIADLVEPGELRPGYIIPNALDARVPPAVAEAVARAALQTNQARVLVDPRVVRDNTREYLYGGELNPVIGEMF